MSVIHNLQIVPKSNTVIELTDVNKFISKLFHNGLIESEITILTGENDAVQNISDWDFKNNTTTSELTNDSKLLVVPEKNIEDLSKQKNYAFKIHLTKTSRIFENLEVFKITNRAHFPLFISLLESPIDFILNKEDEISEEFEQVTLTNINCIISSSGRNSESLSGLAENQHEFEDFFEKVRQLLGDFETGTYYL